MNFFLKKKKRMTKISIYIYNIYDQKKKKKITAHISNEKGQFQIYMKH